MLDIREGDLHVTQCILHTLFLQQFGQLSLVWGDHLWCDTDVLHDILLQNGCDLLYPDQSNANCLEVVL